MKKPDANTLAERGATYVHNPSAGGAGGPTQPWPEFLAAGVRTNIGIDTHSNDHLENLKLAVLYGQARHSLLAETSAAPLTRPTIWDAVRAATLGGADAGGTERSGVRRAGDSSIPSQTILSTRRNERLPPADQGSVRRCP